MTPEQKQQWLAEIAERASRATAPPWRVNYMETTHRLGSSACKETCEKGKPPVRIEHQSEQEAARTGYPGITEIHIHRHVEMVEDIVADDGSHVFCAGHDYDERGTIASDNAEFIAHAREDVEFLLSLVKEQEAGSEASVRGVAAERVAHAARMFCEELQEDADGVPQQQLTELHASLDDWEASSDERKFFDDGEHLYAALASLVEDGYATDHQRRVARLALTTIQGHDEELDKELRRWQNAIRDKMIDLGVPDSEIDGAGCDSGDPLDFTLAEVGQGCGHFIDKIENATTAMRSACLGEVKTLWTTSRSADYNDAINDAVRKLESLSIEQPKEQQR